MALQDNLWKADHDIDNEIHLHYVLLESRSVQVNCLTTTGFHHSAHMPPLIRDNKKLLRASCIEAFLFDLR